MLFRSVERIAACLPDGYQLAVKEHPNPIHPIPINWTRTISKIPRVVLVPTQVNAHDLIKGAAAIVTVSSDVGWEALAYGKPVVSLNRPWWGRRGLSADSLDWSDLPGCLAKVLDPSWSVDRERFLCLVNAMYRSVQPHPFLGDHSDPAGFLEALDAGLERLFR